METKETLFSAFIKQLADLQGKECWSFIGGPGTGSMLTLDFGEKMLRERPVRNPTLTTEQRNYIGEIRLFIQNAGWRIDDDSSVICSSTSSNDLDGSFGKGLRLILNQRVERIVVSHPGLDLRIEFEGKMVLTVFCDQANSEDEACNYSVHLNKKTFAIEAYSKLTQLTKKVPRAFKLDTPTIAPEVPKKN